MGRRKVIAGKYEIGEGEPLTVMSGPCVIESESHIMKMAEELVRLFEGRSSRLIFKSSFDKANRSSVTGFRGPGIDAGLKILERVKKEFHLPIVTDIHTPDQAVRAADVCDILQIPAFLCRQTDLLLSAANTGACISVKKGQFLSPEEMKNVVEKISKAGNENIICTDRGTSFGYNNLVSDMRAIPIMQSFGYPVCFDATHSVQKPGGLGSASGGERQFVPILARSAVAAGADLLFLETHNDPENAKSDAASQLHLKDLSTLLDSVESIYAAVNK
ncbi:MAG: 3-deoxy-8-phosphooctulonate synthase [Waddliaceae bacterium]